MTKDLAIMPKFDLKTACEEELEGFTMEFINVKIPAGGSTVFDVNDQMVKEIVGVIVDHHPVNALWTGSFDGSKSKPECSAFEGKVGIGKPGGNCKECPLNQFGSHPGGGKACKNMYRVYILAENEAFPLRLILSPASIANFKKYAISLVNRKLRTFGVKTKITLKKDQNPNGITYSKAEFTVESELQPSEFLEMSNYRVSIQTATRFNHIADNTVSEGGEELPF